MPLTIKTLLSSTPGAQPEHRDPGLLTQRYAAPAVRPGAVSLARKGCEAKAVPDVRQERTAKHAVRPKAQAEAPLATVNKGSTRRKKTSIRRPHVQENPTPVLDARQNLPEATVRESRWAADVWKELKSSHMEELLDHLAFLTESSRRDEGSVGAFRTSISASTLAAIDIGFEAATDLDQRIDKWQDDPKRTSMKLCELVLATTYRNGKEIDFKALIDGLQNYIIATDPDHDRSARQRTFFTDRGRVTLKPGKRRNGSDRSKHAGIADSDNRPPSLDNVFAHKLRHFKGYTARDPKSGTARAFSRSGTPFIGGASGTIDGLLLLTSRGSLLESPDIEDKEAMICRHERLICLYSTMMINCGHHSLMECLLPAQAYGYFKNMPDPLKDGYPQAVEYLKAHFDSLGIGTKRLVS